MSVEIDKKDKILFTGFGKHETNSIKDILFKKYIRHDRWNCVSNASVFTVMFENDVREVKDIIASDFVDIMSIFINISPKYIDGVAGICGYVASVASLIQDALESDISVVLSYSLKRHAIATLFGELDKKQNEDFRVVGDLNTEYLPALISSIQKIKQQKYALV